MDPATGKQLILTGSAATESDATFALVLGAVFVGWLIPLFGISLLGFVDGALGALTRHRAARTAAPQWAAASDAVGDASKQRTTRRRGDSAQL